MTLLVSEGLDEVSAEIKSSSAEPVEEQHYISAAKGSVQ